MSYCKSVFPTAYDEYILRNRITQCHGLGQATYVKVHPRPTDKCYWPENVALTKAMEQANLSGLWPSWKEFWNVTLSAPIPIYGQIVGWQYGLKKINEYFGQSDTKTPDDVLAKALKDYNNGTITYEQYMAILLMVARLKQSAPSGLSQFASILKWITIILGITFAGYLVVKFGGLIPTKR